MLVSREIPVKSSKISSSPLPPVSKNDSVNSVFNKGLPNYVDQSSERKIIKHKVWNIIKSYYEFTSLTKHHLDSYNMFVKSSIKSVIATAKEIVIESKDKSKKVEVSFSNIFLEPPSRRIDGSSLPTPIYPMDAMRGNISYGSRMYVDVVCKHPGATPVECKKVYIGCMPVMVGSELCNSYKSSRYEKISRCEDVFDLGGYFITGTTPDEENKQETEEKQAQRKIVIPQERAAPDYVYIFKNRKKAPKFGLYAEIRSTFENKLRTTTNTIGVSDSGSGGIKTLSVLFPWSDKVSIPIGIVFGALGITSEKEMITLITDEDSDRYLNNREVALIIERTFEKSWIMKEAAGLSLDDSDKVRKWCLEYIAREAGKKITSSEDEDDEGDEEEDFFYEDDQSDSEDEYHELPQSEGVIYATKQLSTDFLPHLNHFYSDTEELLLAKGYSLAHYVKRLLVSMTTSNPTDDRDHYSNKKISRAGMILLHQFYNAFKKMVGCLVIDVKKLLDKNTLANIKSFIKPGIISTTLWSALKSGKWFKSDKNTGITQSYEQFNTLGGISAMRKIAVPMGKNGSKTTPPRELHSSHWGIICKSETPEGVKCGLIRHLATGGYVTIGSSPKEAANLVRRSKYFRSMKYLPENFMEGSLWKVTRIFVNGSLLGTTTSPIEFVQELRNARRDGEIYFDTSIAFLEHSLKFPSEIRISTEEGRLARPLLVVEKGVLHPQFTKSMPFIECIQNGIIEFVDKTEEESYLIAMYPHEIEEDHTHCEIHPTLCYGIGASLIPFPDHNQSPRNAYQCLWEEEPVLMADGTLKKIKDVKVGDYVVTFNPTTMESENTKVVGCHTGPTKKEMFRITTISGRSIIATFDHKFMTSEGWKKVEDIIPGKTLLGILPGNSKEKSIEIRNILEKELSEFIKRMPNSDSVLIDYHLKKLLTIQIKGDHMFVPVESVIKVPITIISDITTESENHSFIAGDGFCVHNSAMGKQAIGMPFSNIESVSGSFHTLDYVQKPLVVTNSSCILQFDQCPAGINAMVAVLCRDFNQEDSVELNKSSIQRGFMSSTKWISYYTELREEDGEVWGVPTSAKTILHHDDASVLCEDGLPRIGSRLARSESGGCTIVIGKLKQNPKFDKDNPRCKEKEYTNESITYDHILPGTVRNIEKGITGEGYPYVRVLVVQHRDPIIADKVSARHGQKGTIGMVVNQEDMPYCMRTGEVPDIILNPMAFPSRMTLGMLVEMLTGNAHLSGELANIPLDSIKQKKPKHKPVLSFDRDDFEEMFRSVMNSKLSNGTPFDEFNIEVIVSRLKECGVDGFGDEVMVDGITGRMYKGLVYFGPCYYQKLKHMVVDKVHARSRGVRNTLFRQPTDGRSKGGGFKVGTMERDAMVSQGSAGTIRDRLLENADESRFWMCDICGFYAHVNKSLGIRECEFCKGSKISLVTQPYAAKTVSQEFLGMNILQRVIIEKEND